jgi:hypothetical protein
MLLAMLETDAAFLRRQSWTIETKHLGQALAVHAYNLDTHHMHNLINGRELK